jgi:hypothetical protein
MEEIVADAIEKGATLITGYYVLLCKIMIWRLYRLGATM